MKEVVSLRIKPETLAALDAIARKGGSTRNKLIESLADAAAADPYALAVYEVVVHNDNLSMQMAFIKSQIAIMKKFGSALTPEHLEAFRELLQDVNRVFAEMVANEVENVSI